MKNELKSVYKGLLWFLEGVIVGFGAIMPGISGGTLCVAFGMYLPLISLFSHPKENIRKHGKMLAVFVLGAGFGFVCLSGLASFLMQKSSLFMTCLFVGLITGTFPQLWSDAGAQGRTKYSYISLFLGFILMVILMTMLQQHSQMQIKESLLGFLFCGIVWGLSFIVPGLSSSTLLLFFGLYEPMLSGISSFDFKVLIPLAIGMIGCVLLLSKFITKAYERHHNIIAHMVLGIVTATVVMIFPFEQAFGITLLYELGYIVFGCLLSYALTKICDTIYKK